MQSQSLMSLGWVGLGAHPTRTFHVNAPVVSQEVDQSVGGGDDDLGAEAEVARLLVRAQAAHARRYADGLGIRRKAGKLCYRSCDLGREFARRHENEHIGGGHLLGAMKEALEEGQAVGGRLAGTRDGAAAHVAPAEHDRNARRLGNE